jgi:hypothetical protein
VKVYTGRSMMLSGAAVEYVRRGFPGAGAGEVHRRRIMLIGPTSQPIDGWQMAKFSEILPGFSAPADEGSDSLLLLLRLPLLILRCPPSREERVQHPAGEGAGPPPI